MKEYFDDEDFNVVEAIERDERWIDVHDDDVCREMGILRPFNQSPRDPSVWSKTPNERRILKNTIAMCGGKIKGWHCPAFFQKESTVKAKMIVQLKKNKVFDKTTYSTTVGNMEIGNVLSQFIAWNPRTQRYESLVKSYTFNGKTYSADERPWINTH